jgi:hypothetical protein
MNELLNNILAGQFYEARQIMLTLNFQDCHEKIILEAYDSENKAFLKFYEYLVAQAPEDAKLQYAIAEMLTTVFNVLPDGYERAFEHALKAIDLAKDDMSYKEFILLFYNLPRPLLSREMALKFASEILRADSSNMAAREIMEQ